jgi:hypothetical protein
MLTDPRCQMTERGERAPGHHRRRRHARPRQATNKARLDGRREMLGRSRGGRTRHVLQPNARYLDTALFLPLTPLPFARARGPLKSKAYFAFPLSAIALPTSATPPHLEHLPLIEGSRKCSALSGGLYREKVWKVWEVWRAIPDADRHRSPLAGLRASWPAWVAPSPPARLPASRLRRRNPMAGLAGPDRPAQVLTENGGDAHLNGLVDLADVYPER